MHLHSNPLSHIAIHERTEPFSVRLTKWAKTVEDGACAPFMGMDDCAWYAEKADEVVRIYRTIWHWGGIKEACDNFDHIKNFSGSAYVTSVNVAT
uniref:Uncharacterized protein n=1 Tax=Pseudomonas phage RVTF4 TaxID=3236931 RepID=A0AB39CD10_9VIRU